VPTAQPTAPPAAEPAVESAVESAADEPPAGEPADKAQVVSSMAAIRGVLRARGFRRLWYSTALSSLGDWLGLLATTALATSLASTYKSQNYALGGVLVVRLLPAVILGPVAGAFVDRFDRRRTMVISDAIRFALFLTIPIVHTIEWLLIASFLIECVSLFWLPAKDASVPNLVRRDQIEAANQLSLVTTYGITPVLGAALFSLLSLITNALARHLPFFETNPINLALYFNAATFLVGALVVLFIPEISGRHVRRPAGEQPSLFRLIGEGIAFVRSSRLVGGLIIGLVGAFVGGGVVIGAGKIFVASLGGGNAAYGVLFGCVFIGLGAGMGFGPRIARELSRRRLFGLSIVCGGVSLFFTALMPQVALAMIFVLGVGFGAGVAYLSGTTLIGTEVGDEIRGRIFALLQALIRIVLILSLSAVPFVVATVGRNTFTLPGGAHFTVDGTRFVIIAGGLIAIVLGLLAYRKMDDKSRFGLWADLRTSLFGDSVARRRMAGGGVLVAFEGGEGSGKSTQLAMLAEALRESGTQVLTTQEPGGTPLGGRIRELLLHSNESLTPRAEALLFAADRAHHVDTVVRPALAGGAIVLTDRFTDSSLAYQGAGREMTMEEIRRLSRWATAGLRPDVTVLLDLPAEVGLRRVAGRGTADRLEAESVDFHRRVREAFRVLAEADPRRYLVLDATRPRLDLATQIRDTVERLLTVDSRALRLPRTRSRVGQGAG
jgi:dTMP kinase